MAKRDAMYKAMVFESSYPSQEEMIGVPCDICGLRIVINNWPDGKKRTPKFLDFVVCVDCDPRHINDRYLKKGYRIQSKRKLRIVQLAQVTRALSKFGCLRPLGDGSCKCAGCAAIRLMGKNDNV